MKKVNLRIAELRHKKKITQQELADIVGVSFQTISKWENGGAMPDITYLPVLAEYFEVSVDPTDGDCAIKRRSIYCKQDRNQRILGSKIGISSSNEEKYVE